MKINYQNVTNLVHDIKIVGKGLKTVYSYQRLGRTTKLRSIRKNPRFFIRDEKNKSFKRIRIDNEIFTLKNPVKRFYIDTFSSVVKEERNKVLETFQKVLAWVEKDIRIKKLPLDIGGFRYPIVKDVYSKTIQGDANLKKFVLNLIPQKYETIDGKKEPLDGLDADFRKRFYKNFGVGEIWGKKVKGKILSVWVGYLQISNADVYRTDNERFFVVEHYIEKDSVSKNLDIYSDKFRYKLYKFVIDYGNVKGRYIKVGKSVLPLRLTVGIVGWYPITNEGMKFIAKDREKIKKGVRNARAKANRSPKRKNRNRG